MKKLHLYLSDDYLGELIGDASYYRLTRPEAEHEYARIKARIELSGRR